MNFEYWLPQEAYSVALVDKAICGPMVEWSEAWFVGAVASVSNVRTIGAAEEAATQLDLKIGGLHAALVVSGAAKRNLFGASLGVDPSRQTSSETDTRLLDAFARKIGQNLLNMLDAIFSRNPNGVGKVKVAITLSIGSREILDIIVPDHLLVPVLKAGLGSTRRPAPLTGRRTDALRRTKLVARAVLGYADLSLSEVRELCTGDVLILDRTLEDPIELRVAGDGPPVARGKIRRNGDKISIQL